MLPVRNRITQSPYCTTAFGSQPDLQSAPRRRLGSDQARNTE